MCSDVSGFTGLLPLAGITIAATRVALLACVYVAAVLFGEVGNSLS